MKYTLQHLSDAPNVPADLDGTAGDCISVKAGTRRRWWNTGTTPLKLIVMKILK